MRAAILRHRSIELDEVPDPVPGEGEVLLRVRACGICGSDLHFATHGADLLEANRDMGLPVATSLDRDVVMGHEFAAELVEHGPGCERAVAPGSLVTAFPLTVRDGMPVLVGFSNDLPGAYSEYVVVAEAAALPVPAGLDPDVAALTEPMAVGRHAVARAEIGDDGIALVVGCGPIGLAVIACLRARGVTSIVASDPSPRRRALAATMGATTLHDPAADPAYTGWLGLVVDPTTPADTPYGLFTMPSMRPTTVFECVGVPGILHRLALVSPPRTRIVVVGVCMEPDTLHPIVAVNKELEFRFVLGYSTEEFAETLADLASGALDPRPMLTGRVGLGGVADAFTALATPEDHAKIIVDPGAGDEILPWVDPEARQ